MKNWNLDGWHDEDWENLKVQAGEIRAIGQVLEDGIGRGGEFSPTELPMLTARIEAVWRALWRIRQSYGFIK